MNTQTICWLGERQKVGKDLIHFSSYSDEEFV